MRPRPAATGRPDRPILKAGKRALRPLWRVLTGFVLPLLVFVALLGGVEALLGAFGLGGHSRQLVRLAMFGVYGVVAVRLMSRGSSDQSGPPDMPDGPV